MFVHNSIHNFKYFISARNAITSLDSTSCSLLDLYLVYLFIYHYMVYSTGIFIAYKNTILKIEHNFLYL